jgi:hypothetical protein
VPWTRLGGVVSTPIHRLVVQRRPSLSCPKVMPWANVEIVDYR